MSKKTILLFSLFLISLQPNLYAMDKGKKALFDEIKLQTCANNMAWEWREEALHKKFVEDAAERILNAFVWPSCECVLQKQGVDTCDAIMKEKSTKQLEKEYILKESQRP